MRREIDLITVDDIDKIAWICREAVDTEPHIVVVYPTTEEKISAAQRRLYWKWMHEIAVAKGDHDDRYYHLYYKEKFLLQIYYRDDKPDYSFQAMCDSIKAVQYKDIDAYRAIRKEVIRLVSITTASVKQMTEYMNKVKIDAAHEGVLLTEPDMQGLI